MSLFSYGNPQLIAVSITSGQALSAEIDLKAAYTFGIQMPAGWDAAAITFLVAEKSGGTYQSLYDDSGTEVTVASADVVAGRSISLVGIAAKLAPWRFVKLRSGTTALPVNQTSARSFNILAK